MTADSPKPAEWNSAASVDTIKKPPVSAVAVSRVIFALVRPAFAMQYSQAMSADELYRASEMRRTGKAPKSSGPDLSSIADGLIVNLNYFGFTMTQNAARLAAAGGLILTLDQLFKDVRKGFGWAVSVHAGTSYGGVKLTELILATGNHIRHSANWRDAKDPSSITECLTLKRAAIADPLSVDVPVEVLRLIGATYFLFEDAVVEALSDLMLVGAGVSEQDRIRSLSDDFLGKTFNLSMDVAFRAIDDATK
jgi:hypothetical protein